MKTTLLILTATWLVATFPSFSQRSGSGPVGGPCKGCEAIYESPVPFEKLAMFLTIPATTWSGKKPLGVNGTVYKADGNTPAPNVVIYLYHTDETGHYAKQSNETGGPLPSGLPEYYIDECVFDDDPLLTPTQRQALEGRGGSGILKLEDVGNMVKAERNIYLDRNIPNYPAGR